MVAVRMVSEGVDVPRLSVGVYATSTSTPLFFAQAVGRFVRARKRGETASVFLPSVPQLMALANSMEAERDHALDRPEKEDGDGLFNPEDSLMDEANREDKASDSLTKGKFEALDSQASFDRVLFDGGEFGTGGDIGSEDELDFLGIPGLLDAEQVGMLLRQRQHEQQSRKKRQAPCRCAGGAAVPDHRMLMDLRNELAKNVAAWSARTGTPARRGPHQAADGLRRPACGAGQRGTAAVQAARSFRTGSSAANSRRRSGGSPAGGPQRRGPRRPVPSRRRRRRGPRRCPAVSRLITVTE